MLMARAQEEANDNNNAGQSLNAVAGKTYQWKGQFSSNEAQDIDSCFSFEVKNDGTLAAKPDKDTFEQGQWSEGGNVKFSFKAGDKAINVDGQLRAEGNKLVLERTVDNTSFCYVCFV
mmetsp:Transcript_18941/g.13562  ORF Transcript_18941/g.13562 Transcript_18941/m.13562 type:complete len:118 (+) Transcript_18941:1604-1957(+)